MSVHAFEPKFELSCIAEIVNAVRSGEFGERKFELIQHGAWFIGCASARIEQLFEGDDEPQPYAEVGVEPEKLETEDICARLQELSSFGDAGPERLDVGTILMIVKLVTELLKRFM